MPMLYKGETVWNVETGRQARIVKWSRKSAWVTVSVAGGMEEWLRSEITTEVL